MEGMTSSNAISTAQLSDYDIRSMMSKLYTYETDVIVQLHHFGLKSEKISVIKVKTKIDGNRLFCHFIKTNGDVFSVDCEPTDREWSFNSPADSLWGSIYPWHKLTIRSGQYDWFTVTQYKKGRIAPVHHWFKGWF